RVEVRRGAREESTQKCRRAADRRPPAVSLMIADDQEWLRAALPQYERLTLTVESLLKSMIHQKGIDYLSVFGRTKTVDAALEKISRKKYDTPRTQFTDLAGVRVITYLESQVDDITKIIRALFQVDEQNSLDRSAVLGSD